MNEVTVGIVFLVILLLLFGTGIELGFAMALVGMAGFAYLNGYVGCYAACGARYL